MESVTKFAKEGRLIIGTKRTLKLLKEGKIKKVYVASTCPKNILEIIEKYSKDKNIKVIYVEKSSRDFGKMLGKPFLVTVAGVKHGKDI